MILKITKEQYLFDETKPKPVALIKKLRKNYKVKRRNPTIILLLLLLTYNTRLNVTISTF